MRELRKDPVLGRWVVISTERAERPYEFTKSGPPSETPCPFCRDAAACGAILPAAGEMPASVRHEIVVECAEHGRPFDLLTDAEALLVVRAWAGRLRLYSAGFAAAMVIKNSAMPDRLGRVFVDHARSEIVALPVVPKRLAEELREASAYAKRTGVCLYCGVLAEERRSAARVVDENERFTAFCPYASHSPYETVIYPRRHAAHFADCGEEELLGLARILKSVSGRIRSKLFGAPYYFVLHSAPFALRGAAEKTYHWHAQIAPRTFFAAGFEWGGGVYINSVPPEKAAADLRQVVTPQ